MRRWIGLGLLMISMLAVNACRTTDAASIKITPCEIALADHDGNAKLDEEIREAQKKIRASQNQQQSLPVIETLGWNYVEKARASFDPGFYKLAEQCAACLESKSVHLAKVQTPAQAVSPMSQKSAKEGALLLRGHVMQSLTRFAEAEQIARQLTA